MIVPSPGDEMFVARKPSGEITEAFSRKPGEPYKDITSDVGSVEVSRDSIHITGRRVFPGVDPWSVSCDRDKECTDELLRGTVRPSAFDWPSQCQEHVEANIERYRLSPREAEVARLLFTPWSYADIAEEISLHVNTVQANVNRIANRLDLETGRGGLQRHLIVVRLLDCEELGDD